MSELSSEGHARMVDVSAKPVTSRQASASALLRLGPEAAAALRGGTLSKGDALAVARVAGIMAAKRTSELIPLCHPLALDGIDVSVQAGEDGVEIFTTVRSTGPTGVEMEALVAASVAALTIYDMCKALDKGIVIERVQLEEKSGGRSGDWKRSGGKV